AQAIASLQAALRLADARGRPAENRLLSAVIAFVATTACAATRPGGTLARDRRRAPRRAGGARPSKRHDGPARTIPPSAAPSRRLTPRSPPRLVRPRARRHSGEGRLQLPGDGKA